MGKVEDVCRQNVNLYSFFEGKCSHLKGEDQHKEAKRLTDAVVSLVNSIKDKEADRQRDADLIRAACKKIDLALQNLGNTKGPEGQYFKNELQKVMDRIATPVEKGETGRSLIFSRNIGEEPEEFSVVTERKKGTGDQAELMFELWAFWVRKFKEKPSRSKDHPFFELVRIVLGIDSISAYRQWLRNTKEVTKTT